MLLLLDLDNTLVDRDGAFSAWTHGYIAAHGGDNGDLRWLLAADGHGYTRRDVVADGLIDRLHLTADRPRVIADLMRGHVDRIRCYDGVPDALRALRAAGDELVVVTNGSVEQQTHKIRAAGLGQLVDRVVISESVGVKKPSSAFFDIALRGRASAQPTPWMIGDHAENDIDGGSRAGCRTGWVSHGGAWAEGPPPTVAAETTLGVLDAIAARRDGR